MYLSNKNKDNTISNLRNDLKMTENYKYRTSFEGFNNVDGEEPKKDTIIDKAKNIYDYGKDIFGKIQTTNKTTNSNPETKEVDKPTTGKQSKTEAKIFGMHPVTLGVVTIGLVATAILVKVIFFKNK